MPNLHERPNYEKYLRNSALHVYKVSPNSTTHKSQQFRKGVWWISLYLVISLLLLPVLDVTYSIGVKFCNSAKKHECPAMFWRHYQRINRAVSAPQLSTVYTDSITQTDRRYLGMDVSGGSRQVRWKARGQPSQQISSPPSLHTAHSSSL